jgi:hypothetical protein
LAREYPKAKTIHLVMDNLNIHCRKSLGDVFGAALAAQVCDRFTVHTRLFMEAGSIRQRSKSESSPGNVCGAEESPI